MKILFEEQEILVAKNNDEIFFFYWEIYMAVEKKKSWSFSLGQKWLSMMMMIRMMVVVVVGEMYMIPLLSLSTSSSLNTTNIIINFNFKKNFFLDEKTSFRWDWWKRKRDVKLMLKKKQKMLNRRSAKKNEWMNEC